MTTEVFVDGKSSIAVPIVKDITPDTTSYTFSAPRGLLFTTQFAQPAIMVAEKARFGDLRANGLVQDNASFTGHSLGEYASLAAMAEFMPFNSLMDVIFYRGLAMQFAVERDVHGSTNYSMVAVNPGRVGKCKTPHPFVLLPTVADRDLVFNEEGLRWVIRNIAKTSQSLLQIVNFNCEGEQYVCTGTVSNPQPRTSFST